MQLLRNAAANFLGDARGATGKVRAVADIQIGLIQRQRLNQLGVIAKDGVNLPGGRLVSVHPRFDDQQIRTQLERLPRRHGRAHPVAARLVIAGGDHPAAIRRTAHGQRLALQARVVTHLDGGVETVAIHMDDFSLTGKRLIIQWFHQSFGFDTRFDTRFFIHGR